MYQRPNRRAISSKTCVAPGAVADVTASRVMGTIPTTTIVRPTRISGPAITGSIITHIRGDITGRISSIASLAEVSIIPFEERRASGTNNLLPSEHPRGLLP